MSREEFLQSLYERTAEENAVDKDYILEYLKENYKSDYGIPPGFDKFQELNDILTLAERIKAKKDTEDTMIDSLKVLVYSMALLEGNKHKIDIFKVYDDFGINEIMIKYKGEENGEE